MDVYWPGVVAGAAIVLYPAIYAMSPTHRNWISKLTRRAFGGQDPEEHAHPALSRFLFFVVAVFGVGFIVLSVFGYVS